MSRLAALAGKYKVFLVMGVVERAGYTLYNTVLFFDPLGKYLGKHRKLMPTALERVFWGFGDGSTIPVYDTPLGKIGALICWENRMPLLRTAMYAKGIPISWNMRVAQYFTQKKILSFCSPFNRRHNLETKNKKKRQKCTLKHKGLMLKMHNVTCT